MPQRPTSKAPLLPGDGPLARMPAMAGFLVVVVVFAVGVLVGGVPGAMVLGVLALALAALLRATWGALASSQRAGRVLVLLILVALAVLLAVR